jgi:hypothetical protein
MRVKEEAKRMIALYANSVYKPEDRAYDNALAYPTGSEQAKFWLAVQDAIHAETHNKLTKEQLHDIALNHLPTLGGFASKLAAAYLHADGDNQRRIESVFMHLFERANELNQGESK